ncbi:MAG: hypothetical protein JWN57_1188, partial [Frankiales bacterium]|nr:hypothetical protein [Frankiales bacterium]
KLIPKDVRAQLLPKTLFGEKFVALVLPDGNDVTTPIAEGDVIPQDRSETALETEKVLDDLLPLLRTLKPEQLSTTLNAVAGALRGRGERIGENLVAVDAYFTRLNPEMPGLQENIERLAQLSEDYDEAAPDVLAMLDNFSAIGRNLVDQQEELGTFLASTASSVGVLDDVLTENEKRFVTLAEDSLPSLLLYQRYSPEFPCLISGLNRYQPIVEDTFGGLQPGLHITLEVTEDQDGYLPGDEQENRDTRGPHCDGLPSPRRPAPDVEFQDGYRDAERAGIGSGGSGGSGGGTAAAAAYDPARSLADPFSQRQILKAAAAPVLGVPVDEVPDLVEMLFGPVARGTTVGLA